MEYKVSGKSASAGQENGSVSALGEPDPPQTGTSGQAVWQTRIVTGSDTTQTGAATMRRHDRT